MSLTINFAPQTEAWINQEAHMRGLHPVELILQLVESQIQQASTDSRYRTAEEHIAAMDSVAAKNAELPILSDSAFDRESIYEDSL